MTLVTWSAEALADVEKYRQLLAQWSPLAEHRFLVRLDVAVVRPGQFPLSGRVVAEFGERGFREVIVAPYRVL